VALRLALGRRRPFVSGVLVFSEPWVRSGAVDAPELWTAEHKYGTATTQEFIDLSEQIPGQDLSDFFQVWLYTPEKPTT
jgi:aminopeptidase N